jgi:hypothetical protein
MKNYFLSFFVLFFFLHSQESFCQNKTNEYDLPKQFFNQGDYSDCLGLRYYNWLDDSVKLSLAVKYINENTSIASYRMMVQIDEHHPNVYKRLSDSTKLIQYYYYMINCPCTNDWSYLTLEEQDDKKTAKSFMKLGKQVLPYLKLLIYDNAFKIIDAGSESALLNSKYKYRRRDFAYRYAALILGKKPVFLRTPTERDKIIDAFIKEYPEYFGNN